MTINQEHIKTINQEHIKTIPNGFLEYVIINDSDESIDIIDLLGDDTSIRHYLGDDTLINRIIYDLFIYDHDHEREIKTAGDTCIIPSWMVMQHVGKVLRERKKRFDEINRKEEQIKIENVRLLKEKEQEQEELQNASMPNYIIKRIADYSSNKHNFINHTMDTLRGLFDKNYR